MLRSNRPVAALVGGGGWDAVGRTALLFLKFHFSTLIAVLFFSAPVVLLLAPRVVCSSDPFPVALNVAHGSLAIAFAQKASGATQKA